MMRECQMQISGPWPPYHFVHRLTRGAHTPVHSPVAPAASQPPVMQPMAPRLETILASA
jgi:hypothetical protein